MRVLLALPDRCWWDRLSVELADAIDAVNRHRWQPLRFGGGLGAGAGGGEAERAGESRSLEVLIPSIASSTCDSWSCRTGGVMEVALEAV